jgi:hypothetical protein
LATERSKIHPRKAVQAVFRISARRGISMFESLEERIDQDEKQEISTKDRIVHYLTISAVSVVVVGGIAAAFQFVK